MKQQRYINANLKPVLAKLEIASRKTTSPSALIGKYKSFYKGAGLEFEGYREYTPADDASKIDWKASIRSNELVIKEFAQAKNLLLYLMIDTSDSMISGTTEKLKNEYAAEVGAFIAYNVLVDDDNIGFALYSDGIKGYRLPKRGNKQFYIMSKYLLNPDMYGGPSNLAKSMRFLMTFLMRGSVVMIISDFLHLSKDDIEYLKMAANKFEVIAFIVRDPVDYVLPMGMEVLVEDPITRKSEVIDTSTISHDYEQNAKIMLDSLKSMMLSANIDFIELKTNKPFLHDVLAFFRRRQGKWK